MFDIKLIREELETVKKGLAAKGAKIILDDVLQKDKKRRGNRKEKRECV